MSKQSAQSNKKQTGSLKKSKPVFLTVAKIFKPHALRGEVSADFLTDFPERIEHGKTVYIGKKHIPLKINTIRKASKKYLISFFEHTTRDSVEHLRNEVIYIKSAEVPSLSENEYYHHDLIGIQVNSGNNEILGKISEIIETGANDVYVIKSVHEEGKEILIPAIKGVIKQIDIENRVMIVDLPEWN